MKPSTKRLVLPVKNVIVSHTASSAHVTLEACLTNVLSIQNEHLIQFSDIAYNFLICSDGSIIEGRGWYIEGSHAFGTK